MRLKPKRIDKNLQLFVSLLLIALLSGLCSQVASAADLSTKRVLLLYSYHPMFPTSEPVMRGIRSVLDKHHVAIETEYMDTKRHADAEHEANFLRMLAHKLANRLPYDAVLVADDNAFNFALAHRARLFPGVPVIFLAVNNKAKALDLDRDPLVTGVVEAISVDENLRLAQRLWPGIKRVYLVVDATESGNSDRLAAHQAAAQFPELTSIELNLGELSWLELGAKLRGLPRDSVVLRLASYRDREGVVLDIQDVIGLITQNSPVPVLALREHGVAAGALGGHVINFEEQGRQAALMVERILSGTPVDTLKVLGDSPNRYMFNYSMLKRFGIALSALPPNSIVLNKPTTILDNYAREVWLALGFISLLLILIAYLGLQIKARRRAEQEVIRHRDHLEEMVTERTASLVAANKEIESFSYSVSHDLRGPLRGIDGFSQVVLEEYGEKLDEQGRGYLMRVRRGAQHMAHLIDDLLQLSRITRYEMTRKPVDLTKLAAYLLSELQSQEPKRQDVEFAIAPDLTVNGDPRLIEIALRNLLGNAWKYTGKQPGARIELGSTTGPKGQVFFVRDNGVGFDMKYADKLFKPFQRLHTLDEFPGTGVGLATVARVIARHGGEIWVESQVGRGATFYFTLTPS